jgi:uncharacterized membrane protein
MEGYGSTLRAALRLQVPLAVLRTDSLMLRAVRDTKRPDRSTTIALTPLWTGFHLVVGLFEYVVLVSSIG